MAMMRLLTLSLLAVSGILLAQEPADWRFAHPSATLVGGVRLKAILESPILQAIVDQASAKDPSVSAMSAMLKGALAQVEEVRYSVLDRGNGRMDALLMVNGKLDPALVNLVTQNQTQSRLLDERTMLLGESGSLEEAVRRLSEPPALLRNRALLRGSTLTGCDFWVAGSLPDSPMTSALKVNLRGLAVGFSLGDNVTFQTALEAATPQGAEELVRAVRAAEAQQPQWAGMVEAAVAENTATFRVSVPRDRVLAAIREGTAGQWLSQMGGTLPAAPQPPPKPAAPKRNTIIIQGLEGGPREIPAGGR
jgi:hypothetical protein